MEIWVSQFNWIDDPMEHTKHVYLDRTRYYCMTCACNIQSIQQQLRLIYKCLYAHLPYCIIEIINSLVLGEIIEKYNSDRSHHMIFGKFIK